MKFEVLIHLCLLVFTHVCEAADYLRHSSEMTAKAITRDEPVEHRSQHPTVMHSKAAETQMFNEQRATQATSGVFKCEDKDNRCVAWAQQGECDKNPSYMLANCERSCNVCQADGTQKIKLGPLGEGRVRSDHDSSEINIDATHPHKLAPYDSIEEAFWGKRYLFTLLAYIPYALMVVLFAMIWLYLDGRIPPECERNISGGRDFEYGLCDTDHVFTHHMWICVCAFCCCPIRMADTYSKEGKTKPIITGFWAALALTLLMGFLVDLSCGIATILFLCFAVYFRQRIRETYGLPRGGKTLAWDCLFWCFCPWCTAAQEARQIECAGIYDGKPPPSAGISVNSGYLRR
mmetsp:Transcript_10200/g.16565  ORF Transcript_10200/g.16565 Transcript_10200/m.16565 type:complete len:347 (-) Transcript_10200:110-1150(-)